MSVILGIDPGSRNTGYGLLETSSKEPKMLDVGVIELPPKDSLASRLSELGAQLDKILEKFKPSVVAVEKVFLGKNPDSAFKLGHARGVCLAVAARHGAEVVEYAPRKVKKGVTGSGAADKEQVSLVLANLLRNPQIVSMGRDATDALALAYCHWVISRATQLVQAQRKGAEL